MSFENMDYRAQVQEYIRFTEGNKEQRIRDLASYAKKGGVLFLGDSLTEGFPSADLLPEYKIVNRGYSGDTAEKLKDRLPYTCFPYQPRAVFLQVGTNDLAQGVREEEVVSRIGEICAEIVEACGTVKICLVSLFPLNESAPKFQNTIVSGEVKKRTNAQIEKTNSLLKQFAEASGFDYLNLGECLKDGNGELSEEYSTDGLHLTVAGYAVLSQALKPYLENIFERS